MNRALVLIGGIGAGAVLIYLLDPARGRRRRKLLGDQMVRATRVSGEAAEGTARDVRNRGRGQLAELRARFRREEVDDAVLVERVRAAMGRVVSHPSAIEVTAEGGRVTLRGPILADEVDELLGCVASVRGVNSVDNQLTVHTEAGDVPGLQGGGARPGRRPDVMQRSWSPTMRLAAGTAGGALALYGVTRRDPLGALLGVAGLGLCARAVTNVRVRRLTGIGAGRRAVRVHKTITVNAPVEEVFQFWANFENFPCFMEHVREVRVSRDGRASHWTVTGPAGVPVSFNAEITKIAGHERLAWKTLPGAAVRHAGVIRFEPTPDGGTRLDIRMSYNPVAGAVGHTVAALFGADPKRAMDEDLVRFKSLIEEGKTTAHRQEVTREEIAPAQAPPQPTEQDSSAEAACPGDAA